MKQIYTLFVVALCAATACSPAPAPATASLPAQSPAPASTLPPTITPLANSSSSDSTTNIPDPCTLLTDSEIKAVLNKTVRQMTPVQDPFGLSDVPGMADKAEYASLKFARRCEVTLNAASGGLANPELLLTVIPGRTALDLDRSQKAKPSLLPVQDVGDLALWSADTLELEFMKGLTDIKLAVVDESIGPATDQAHKLDQARSLAARILSPLP